jgi:hypothetical protein
VDFGGLTGEVLCGELVQVAGITLHRRPDGSVFYTLKVERGDYEPVRPDVEGLFDVVPIGSVHTDDDDLYRDPSIDPSTVRKV